MEENYPWSHYQPLSPHLWSLLACFSSTSNRKSIWFRVIIASSLCWCMGPKYFPRRSYWSDAKMYPNDHLWGVYRDAHCWACQFYLHWDQSYLLQAYIHTRCRRVVEDTVLATHIRSRETSCMIASRRLRTRLPLPIAGSSHSKASRLYMRS